MEAFFLLFQQHRVHLSDFPALLSCKFFAHTEVHSVFPKVHPRVHKSFVSKHHFLNEGYCLPAGGSACTD